MSFRDRDWNQALRDFSEGLNVSSYAAAEEIQIPDALLESLYVNRAAAFHSVVRHSRRSWHAASALQTAARADT